MQLKTVRVLRAQLISLVILDSKANTNLLLSASMVESLILLVVEYLELGLTLAGYYELC